MRKLLLAAALVLMLCPLAAQAVEMNLVYDEIYHYYNEPDVFIELDGRPVATKEMPPVILMDRTLVPVREVFESLGASVTWINETGQTKISYNGTEVLFTTGSRSVYLGRSKISIPDGDPAPMIINDKTMVPVRIVANLLGYDVEWDDARRTVKLSEASAYVYGGSTSTTQPQQPAQTQQTQQTQPAAESAVSAISVEKHGAADLVYLTYAKPVKPSVARYNTPERVVLDFPGAVYAGGAVQGSGTIVKDVRAANHDGMARIVLDVDKQPNIEIYRAENGIVIVATAASGKYATNIGDLTDGAVFSPDSIPVSEPPKDDSSSGGGSGGAVELDTSGTVDTTTTKEFDYNTVVIDAGHGGSDPGAMGGNVRESAITLAISEKVIAKLRAAGYTVIATRTSDDVKPTLQQRAEIANQKRGGKLPAIFVSIHCNSFENPDSNGTQVYYDPDSKYGTILAENIYNANLAATGLKAGQIHDGSHLYVVRTTLQPAALVETAFISNSSDRAYLTSEAGQEAFASGITEGIIKTIDRMKADKGL